MLLQIIEVVLLQELCYKAVEENYIDGCNIVVKNKDNNNDGIYYSKDYFISNCFKGTMYIYSHGEKYSPDSHFFSASILIFLSSLFIISDNFGTAKKYIINCLKLSCKELELRLEINQSFSLIDLNEYKENEQKKINKIIFNIAICFII